MFCHIRVLDRKRETYQYWLCYDWLYVMYFFCVIPHIREDVFKNSNRKHHIQVNNFIKTLFYGSSEKDLHGNLDTFWSEYKKFHHKNNHFDSNEFIWSSKDIRDGNSHLCHQKYSLPCTKVLDVVSFRITSEILEIISAERSWGDVKAIKSGKISAIGSGISEKQSIVYTSAWVEEEKLWRTISNTDSKYGPHSHYWNY